MKSVGTVTQRPELSGLCCFRLPDMTGREAADRPARGGMLFEKAQPVFA